MSIHDEINSRCAEGRLFLLEPALPGARTDRTILMSAEVQDYVLGPWSDKEQEYRANRLRADLDAFIEGEMISANMEDPYKKPKSTYIARVDPISHDVWDIRSRDPNPGIRVLGCFSETDVFVALVWDFRENLGGPGAKEWRDFIERCRAEWRKLFPTYPPPQGEDIHDYISENVILV